MKGTALFIGGPLDERLIDLPDMVPVYRVPVKDRRYSIKEEDMSTSPSFGELLYIRKRMRRTVNGQVVAIYEVDM